MLEYTKDCNRQLCRNLRGVLYRCGTHLDKIRQIGLKLALVEKCSLAAFIVACTLDLAVGVLPITPG